MMPFLVERSFLDSHLAKLTLLKFVIFFCSLTINY